MLDTDAKMLDCVSVSTLNRTLLLQKMEILKLSTSVSHFYLNIGHELLYFLTDACVKIGLHEKAHAAFNEICVKIRDSPFSPICHIR